MAKSNDLAKLLLYDTKEMQMNPLLILMIFVVAVALWFALRKTFRPLGEWMISIMQDTKEIIEVKEEDKDDE